MALLWPSKVNPSLAKPRTRRTIWQSRDHKRPHPLLLGGHASTGTAVYRSGCRIMPHYPPGHAESMAQF